MTDLEDESDAPKPVQPQQATPPVNNLLAALKAAGDAGANWFFWIAALSLVNTAMAHSGAERHFVVGLSVTAIVDGVAAAIGKENPEAASFATSIAVGFSLFVALVVVLFGWLSRKRVLWIFAIGMGLYVIDGLIYLLIGDFMSAAFHGYAFYSMTQGFKAYQQMSQLEDAAAVLQTDDIFVDQANG